jgi:cytochrome P450
MVYLEPSHVQNGRFDPHDPSFIEDPYPTWAELRERCPVVHSDRYMGGFWTISRYEDVKAAVTDWRTFTSAVAGVTGIPMMIQRNEPLIPIEYDPPQHTRYRTLVSPLFRRDRVEELRPTVRAFADNLLDPLVAVGAISRATTRSSSPSGRSAPSSACPRTTRRAGRRGSRRSTGASRTAGRR